MTADVKPTRSELIALKRRIKLSEMGHRLLKMKRDGLILEFFAVLNKANDVRSKIVGDYLRAEQKRALAEAVDGALAIQSAAFALRELPALELGSKNIMGVLVPRVEARAARKRLLDRGYGVLGTTDRIDAVAEAYEALLEDVLHAAEVETSLRKLLDEIEATKRRVNALEFRVIPRLKEQAAFITLRLEEMERENIFRLKRIKAKGEREAAAAAAA